MKFKKDISNQFILFLTLIFLLTACKGPSGSGELVGVQSSKLKQNKTPHGMVLIPAGTFIMGQSDEDITFSQTAQNRQVTVGSFYMDDTEISNSEYKQFVHWVRDSVLIHNFLGDDTYFLKGNSNGDARVIDWRKVEKQSPWRTKDAAKAERLASMYYQGEDRVFGKNEFDVRLLLFNYEWYDIRQASANKNNPSKKRSDFIIRDTINIYPDTSVWLTDFSYAQNEPMVNGYFSHPSFNEYPVVGVTWKQAQAFNAWRTKLFNDVAVQRKNQPRFDYQLPTEAQWEYAARGGKIGMQFPWGGPSSRTAKGCLMANFKPGRGNYIDDGVAYTAPVYSYFPNDFGLYNMAGNVAEWTQSSYNESSYTFVHDMNPTYTYNARDNESEVMKRKVVRGGSWKDVGFFLQNGTRQYEYQDTAKSSLGFRSVTNYAGIKY